MLLLVLEGKFELLLFDSSRSFIAICVALKEDEDEEKLGIIIMSTSEGPLDPYGLIYCLSYVYIWCGGT